MKATITNNSRAMQGVHSVAGLVFIEPGASKPVDVADDYVDRVKALPFFTSKWGDTVEQSDGGGKTDTPSGRDLLKARAIELKLEFAGNISTAKLKELVDAKEAEPKSFDDMSDTDLKTFLGTKGVVTKDETRDELIALAKAA